MGWKVDWSNTFNSGHKRYGFISVAMSTAETSGYPYFCWNDRVYTVPEMIDTGWIRNSESNQLVEELSSLEPPVWD